MESDGLSVFDVESVILSGRARHGDWGIHMPRILSFVVMLAVTVVGSGPTYIDAATFHVSITDLGILPGDDFSVALAINERGQTVGYSYGSVPGEYHPVLWQNGTIVSLIGSGFLVDINNRGQIVGGRTSISGSEILTHAAKSFTAPSSGGTGELSSSDPLPSARPDFHRTA